MVMAWIYILRGSDGRYCIGSTENLERRIEEHRRDSNHTTRRFDAELKIVIARTVNNAAEAHPIA